MMEDLLKHLTEARIGDSLPPVCSCGEHYILQDVDVINFTALVGCPKGCEGSQTELRFTMKEFSWAARVVDEYSRKVEDFQVVTEFWPERRTCGVPDCWNSARLYIRSSWYEGSDLVVYYGKAKVGGRVTYCCPECAGLSRQELIWTDLGARENHHLKRVSLGMIGDRGHDTSRLSWAAAYTGALLAEESRMKKWWDFSHARPPGRLRLNCWKNSSGTVYTYYSYFWATPYGDIYLCTGYDPDGHTFQIY
jgi:hypothetical protein